MKQQLVLPAAALALAGWGWHEHTRRVEDARLADDLLRASHLTEHVLTPAINSFRATHQRLPANLSDAGLPPSTDSLWRNYDRVNLGNDGSVRFELHTADGPQSAPAELVFERSTSAAATVACFVQGVPHRILLMARIPCYERENQGAGTDSQVELDVGTTPGIQTKSVSLQPFEQVMDAVSHDDAAALARLKQEGADLCAVDAMRQSALGNAARDHQLKALAFLVESSGCVVDIREPASGRTPLQTASAVHDLEAVHLLLEHGADPGQPDATGSSAWMLLGASGTGFSPSDLSVRQTMLARGVQVDNRDARNQTLLMLAVEAGCYDLVQWLLDHGAAIDSQDQSGRTALMHATISRFGEGMLLTLLNHGADVNQVDHSGLSAMMLAQQIPENDRRQRVIWLLSHPQSATQ